MKKVVNIFLILLLSVTFLPISEVGKLLSDNQLIEELSVEVQEKPLNSFGKEVIHYHADFYCGKNEFKISNHNFLQTTDNIPSHPSVEIHVPPPNFC